MICSRSLPLLAAFLLLGSWSISSAVPYVDETTGYRAEIPEGWRHVYDEEGAVLWLAAPGGMRVKVEARIISGGLDRQLVLSHYREDGIQIRETAETFKVLQKPSRSQEMGAKSTIRYGFAYRASNREVRQLRAWLASGPSAEVGRELVVKALAYGRSGLFKTHRVALADLLASFTWPAPPASEPGDRPGEPGPGPVVVAPVVTTPPATRIAAGGSSGGSGGFSGGSPAPQDDLSDLQRPAAGEFDRGSMSGGRGFTRWLKPVADQELADRISRGMGAQDRARDEEEREASAARLGFQPNSPDQ